MTDNPRSGARRLGGFFLVAGVAALVGAGIVALLVTIFQHKQEQRVPFVRVQEVGEETTDPALWGRNWPVEFDLYSRTAETSRTNFGGGDAIMAAEKSDRFPWLTRIFAGYAFSIDYRDRRGHAFMLLDQERTRRVTERPQPGACLHCHTSLIPFYASVGHDKLGAQAGRPEAIRAGFEEVCGWTYQEAHQKLEQYAAAHAADTGGKAHPVSCVDCHDPRSMELRVTRPGFLAGIAAFAASEPPMPEEQMASLPQFPSIRRWRQGDRKQPYDPNRDGFRAEMRSFVCGQCHVEYYFRGDHKTLTYPWYKGLRVEQIEAYYDGGANFPSGKPHVDFVHAETGAPVLKAQHPEFELWNQGIHARSGVACADCHMPYIRQGAAKISDHWVRSPLLDVNRACQTCHHFEESELRERVSIIQGRNYQLLQQAGSVITALLDATKAAKKAGATEAQLAEAWRMQRKAQWRLDFVAAENSMGFHAPQETARILAESIDYARQGQLAVMALGSTAPSPPTPPAAPASPAAPAPAR